MSTQTISKIDLDQFTGTENYYRYGFIRTTDGIQYLAEKAQCYWLLDVVNSYQLSKKIRMAAFQVWELKSEPKTNKTHRAVVTMKEDSDMPNLVRQVIEFTDFPFAELGKELKLYLVDGVLMLPSEY